MFLFKPVPLTFQERRALILRTWQRYGYSNRHKPGKELLELAERVKRLMQQPNFNSQIDYSHNT